MSVFSLQTLLFWSNTHPDDLPCCGFYDYVHDPLWRSLPPDQTTAQPAKCLFSNVSLVPQSNISKLNSHSPSTHVSPEILVSGNVIICMKQTQSLTGDAASGMTLDDQYKLTMPCPFRGSVTQPLLAAALGPNIVDAHWMGCYHCCGNVTKLFCSGPGWRGSIYWMMACEPKDHRFDSQSGHMPGLWARSPVGGVQEATTYWYFSPSLSPSLPLSLKINK